MSLATYNGTSGNYSYRDYFSSPLKCFIYSCSVLDDGLPRLNSTADLLIVCGTRLLLNCSIYASWNTKDLTRSFIDLTFVSQISEFCILKLLDKERLLRHKARAKTGKHEERVYQEES
jgi:hypothetical protein